jgi:phage terminase large subunit-like protein
MERKMEMSIGSWEAEYMQDPIIAGGGQLPVDKLKTVDFFARENIVSSVRYVDKAGTVSDAAAYTAAVLMHVMKDKTYVIEHIMRGRWNALDRESRLKQVCEDDQRNCPDYRVWIEQEPGSGGKEPVEATIRNLRRSRPTR